MSSQMSFRIVDHSVLPDVQIIEVLCDGEVCAAIYPQEGREIKLVSPHMDGDVETDDGNKSFPPIPAVIVRFDPRPSEEGSEGA